MDLNFQLFETAVLFITVLVVAFMLQVSLLTNIPFIRLYLNMNAFVWKDQNIIWVLGSSLRCDLKASDCYGVSYFDVRGEY